MWFVCARDWKGAMFWCRSSKLTHAHVKGNQMKSKVFFFPFRWDFCLGCYLLGQTSGRKLFTLAVLSMKKFLFTVRIKSRVYKTRPIQSKCQRMRTSQQIFTWISGRDLTEHEKNKPAKPNFITHQATWKAINMLRLQRGKSCDWVKKLNANDDRRLLCLHFWCLSERFECKGDLEVKYFDFKKNHLQYFGSSTEVHLVALQKKKKTPNNVKTLHVNREQTPSA